MHNVRGSRALGLSIGLMGLVMAAGCLTLSTTTQEGGGGSGGTSSSDSGAGPSEGVCASINDCPSVTLCKTMACTNGKCVTGFVPEGLQCNGENVCDGKGSCVECNVDADCSGPSASCDDDECISCTDNDKNGDETGVDCGGSKCGRCTGMPCMNANDCASNYCVDGVCCDQPCTADCKACNLANKLGTCSTLPNGQEDPGVCDTTKACSGVSGLCKLKNGQPCTNDLECVSGDCSIQGICEIPD